jgi:hypothetical protein
MLCPEESQLPRQKLPISPSNPSNAGACSWLNLPRFPVEDASYQSVVTQCCPTRMSSKYLIKWGHKCLVTHTSLEETQLRATLPTAPPCWAIVGMWVAALHQLCIYGTSSAETLTHSQSIKEVSHQPRESKVGVDCRLQEGTQLAIQRAQASEPTLLHPYPVCRYAFAAAYDLRKSVHDIYSKCIKRIQG